MEATSELTPAPAIATDEDSEFLPWKIAFRVQFLSEKLGLRFHPAQFPDTGNGVYTIRLLELSKGPDGTGPALNYNASLHQGQEHLALRPGLHLTHINETHLVDVPCEEVIHSLQLAPRPVTLRFVDVEAGIVTPHELRDSIQLDTASPPASPRLSSCVPGSPATPKRSASLSSSVPLYKIILLGTTGVGKSSLLAVAVNGDEGYEDRRTTTLEAEFGSVEFSDEDTGGQGRVKARVWDTAGQERYRAITRSHYRRADGALLVYDMLDVDSFSKLGEWLHALRETAGDSLTAIMVVENKVDQSPASAPRPADAVKLEEVRSFCERQGLLFSRTSAKMNGVVEQWEQGKKVLDVVKQLVMTVHSQRQGGDPPSFASASDAKEPGDLKPHVNGLVLTDAPRAGAKSLASDCGSCSRS